MPVGLVTAISFWLAGLIIRRRLEETTTEETAKGCRLTVNGTFQRAVGGGDAQRQFDRSG